MAPVPLIEIRD
jgi:hypothetical protein